MFSKLDNSLANFHLGLPLAGLQQSPCEYLYLPHCRTSRTSSRHSLPTPAKTPKSYEMQSAPIAQTPADDNVQDKRRVSILL